ncbi:MAG TPA: VCBS repeat-containing protein, partial [Gemmataceae bacterium]
VVELTRPGGLDSPGGSRAAVADITGDGVPDLAAAAGPGGTPRVVVLDGATWEVVFSADVFEPSFRGGVFLAAGDVDGDGAAELAVTPDQGGGPRVRLFRGRDFAVLADFLGIEDPGFRGGARPAFGTFSGGRADLLVAAGFGGGPRVAGYAGSALAEGRAEKLFADFFVFEPALRNGAYLTAGDLDGDGTADLIAGGGPGGAPRVLALSGRDLIDSFGATRTELANFFAGDPSGRGGVRVAAKDLDRDAYADLVTGAGDGSAPVVRRFAGASVVGNPDPAPLGEQLAFAAGFTGGVFVG